ncbi:MAG: ethylbenzene dehydrogenase-related protein [Candidatus Omnitrophota bacterium]|nr:hypothetical protein [Candidatus Omnitrophota bacterium]
MRNGITRIMACSMVASVLFCGSCYGDTFVRSVKVSEEPVIDGSASDSVWASAEKVITHDNVAGIDMEIRTVHTDDRIFFLVVFPDKDESRTHKSWVWDRDIEEYVMGNDREDVFTFKWNIVPEESKDLRIDSDDDYRTDIWFWKACRTDPEGFADDKFAVLSDSKVENSTPVLSRNGKEKFYFRDGDKGKAAYSSKMAVDHIGDTLPRFETGTPSGSRADIKAKGKWEDGKWVVEFSRAMDTGNDDDVRFFIGKKYQFGVSRYEMAGRKVMQDLSQPFYGAGEISEKMILSFEEKNPGRTDEHIL